jgi:ribosomal protein S17
MQNQVFYSSPAPVAPIKPKGRVSFILAIIFGLLTAALGGLSIWLWLQYSDQKNNVDTIAATRVAEATKTQAEKLEADFAEREKQPNLQFTGPDDYGRLVFMYTKTWNLNIGKSGMPYSAYLNPGKVPPIENDARFALRVNIEEKSYEEVIKQYVNQLKKGEVKAEAITLGTADNNVLGTRFNGALTKNIVGSAVVFKIRDKTVVLQTDAQIFLPDYDAILKTISFNK